jgi:hypothetical protein
MLWTSVCLCVDMCSHFFWLNAYKWNCWGGDCRYVFNFLRNCQTFPKWPYNYIFPLGVYKSSRSYIALPTYGMVSQLILAAICKVSSLWYLIVLLICICLITNHFEHFVTCLMAFFIYFVKCLQICPLFQLRCFLILSRKTSIYSSQFFDSYAVFSNSLAYLLVSLMIFSKRKNF